MCVFVGWHFDEYIYIRDGLNMYFSIFANANANNNSIF